MALQNYPAMTPTPAAGTVIARNLAVTPLLTTTATANGSKLPSSWTFPPHSSVGADRLEPFTPIAADNLPALTGVPCYALSVPPGTLGFVRLDLTGIAGLVNGTPVAVSAVYSGDGITLGARLVGDVALNVDTTGSDFQACAASGSVGTNGNHAWGVVSYDDDQGVSSKAVVLRDGGKQADGLPAGTVNGVTNLCELVWRRPVTSTGTWKLLGFRVDLASAQYTTTWVKLPPGIPMTEYFDGSRHSPAVDTGHTFAWNGAADASASKVTIAVPAPADPPPAAPTGLHVTGLTTTGGVLHWNAPADADLDHYRVYKDHDTAQLADVPAGTTEYTFAGLRPHQGVSFTVTAIDKAGHESPRSKPETATTLASPSSTPGTGTTTPPATGGTGVAWPTGAWVERWDNKGLPVRPDTFNLLPPAVKGSLLLFAYDAPPPDPGYHQGFHFGVFIYDGTAWQKQVIGPPVSELDALGGAMTGCYVLTHAAANAVRWNAPAGTSYVIAWPEKDGLMLRTFHGGDVNRDRELLCPYPTGVTQADMPTKARSWKSPELPGEVWATAPGTVAPPATGGTGPTQPAQAPIGDTTTGTAASTTELWLGGEQAKRSQTYPAPLTGADVAEFLNMVGDSAVTATATAQLETVTLLARAYTRGHGFAHVNSKYTERLPNDEIRAVILTATARLVANPEQISYNVGGIGFRDGFHGWSLGELAVLNRFRPRFA